MKLNEIAYFMNRLDNVQEANGKTILDNSLFTISTESGDGRHNNTKRELSGVFHAISSAGGRFKTGQIIDVKAQGLDLYNSIIGIITTTQSNEFYSLPSIKNFLSDLNESLFPGVIL